MRFFIFKIFQLTIQLILVVILITKCSIMEPIENKISGFLWTMIERQLDKEEAERQKAIENHEVVRGKDTACIWNKHYTIWHHMYEYHFGIEIEDASDGILERVIDYDVHKDKFYVIAEEGYAVVDRENYCKVFVTVPEDEFVRGYTEDKEGNRTYISKRVESKYIEYLSEYDDFSEKDKKVFEKMKK